MEVNRGSFGPNDPFQGKAGTQDGITPGLDGVLTEFGLGAPAAASNLRDHQRRVAHVPDCKIMINIDAIRSCPEIK